jgi:hypothetical protein
MKRGVLSSLQYTRPTRETWASQEAELALVLTLRAVDGCRVVVKGIERVEGNV